VAERIGKGTVKKARMLTLLVAGKAFKRLVYAFSLLLREIYELGRLNVDVWLGFRKTG
jgi:hypothetical protein